MKTPLFNGVFGQPSASDGFSCWDWVDGVPTVIVEHGKPIREIMDRARLEESDVLEAARLDQGLERMDQIKYAVLERGGKISIVPEKKS